MVAETLGVDYEQAFALPDGMRIQINNTRGDRDE